MHPSTYTQAMELLTDARTYANLAENKDASGPDKKTYRERERNCRLKALRLLSETS
jgi:hypothetical protein